MDTETVYRFEVWDSDTRTKSFEPRMGTRQAIRRLRGEADLESALTVSVLDVDADGFYCRLRTTPEE